MIEATNSGSSCGFNHGKFMVMKPTAEDWQRRSVVDDDYFQTLSLSPGNVPLLRRCGWSQQHIFVTDLQTGEGAIFLPGGYATADLNKHRIWVCPLFEFFLRWLYQQDLSDIAQLPDQINLADAPGDMVGYRRPGPPT